MKYPNCEIQFPGNGGEMLLFFFFAKEKKTIEEGGRKINGKVTADNQAFKDGRR